MNKVFLQVLLLLCFVICLSACSAKQYELELLSPDTDMSYENSDGLSESPNPNIPEIEESFEYGNIFIHICGAVVNPGVYEVTKDSRVFEVLNLAGGFTEEAATDVVNLAMIVTDGSKIFIPTIDEVLAGDTWTEAVGISDSGSLSSELTGLVNINTATIESLMTLPGIGKVKAESIVAYREEKGRFNKIEDIMKISGIKDAVFSKIKDKICV